MGLGAPRVPAGQDAHLFDTLLLCRPASAAAPQPPTTPSPGCGNSPASSSEPRAEQGSEAQGQARCDASQPGDALAEGAQREQEAVAFRASAFLLAHYSPYFRRALAKEWGGEGKRLELTTASIESLSHLLEWVHSLGRTLPDDTAATAELLSTAHAFAVEECVSMVGTKLAAAASELSWELTSKALHLAAGKECEGEAAASALTALRTALLDRLLQLLGKLDDVLNNPTRLERLCSLQLPALEEVVAFDALMVDCEETVFCVVAHWLNASSLTLEEQVAAAACLLPHVRFAHMRPVNIANYWHAFSWFREWDPDKQVLVEALVHAADPQLAAVSARVRMCQLPAKFARRASYKKPTRLEFVSQAKHGLVGAAAVGPVLDFSLAVGHYSGASRSWNSVLKSENSALLPLSNVGVITANGYRWGWPKFALTGTIDGAPITRANFRSAGSPVVKDGKMAVQVTVTLKS
ncbi:hypothetical protein ABPG75_012582 [Micractinium tetrahymenae]